MKELLLMRFLPDQVVFQAPVVSGEEDVSAQAEIQVDEEELVSECREQSHMNDPVPDVFEDLPELECITPEEDISESVIND